jgi:hypothetical protein
MKRKKIVITLLTILTVMALMISKSFAAGSYSASLTPNNSKVSKGSELKVTLKLSGISVDGGINGVVGTLKFDTDILTLSKSDVKGLDGWTVTYNEDNKKLEIDSAEAITTDKEIATFTFKVKDNTTATNAAIQLVSISAANSTLDNAISISDISTNITIGTSIGGNNNSSNSNSISNDTNNSTSNNTNNATGNQTNNNTARNSVSNNSVANTVSKESNTTTVNNENMPYTGASSYIIPLMLAVLTLGIISFVNYKKIEK